MSGIKAANVKLKRAYEPPEAADGIRILVDRLWPRGVKKTDAAIEQWAKDLAPSTALRKWFGHDPGRWEEFCDRYTAEVSQHPGQLKQLRELAREHPITLIYSAHDDLHNNAVVLQGLILG
jgi:uncharacterized protein YeaO (DUF488 family)